MRHYNPGWRDSETPFTEPQRLQWRSQRLNNTRTVWVYTTGDSDPTQRPLAILLDGQFWAKSMPVWPALASLTRAGQLPGSGVCPD